MAEIDEARAERDSAHTQAVLALATLVSMRSRPPTTYEPEVLLGETLIALVDFTQYTSRTVPREVIVERIHEALYLAQQSEKKRTRA